MSSVSISQLKAQLSLYLREVVRGGEIQVLDRGRPIARLSAISVEGLDAGDQRVRLIQAGVLRAGVGDASEILNRAPIDGARDLRGAIFEDREDRV